MLDAVTSEHSRRSYRAGLVRLFDWIRSSGSAPTFSKALVGEYRAHLLDVGLSAATVNLRLAPVRRLAREMADNGLLDPAVAAAVGRVSGVARHCTRVGNWLNKEQANDLLNAPNSKTLAVCGSNPRTDCILINQNLDGPEVTRKVSCIGVELASLSGVIFA